MPLYWLRPLLVSAILLAMEFLLFMVQKHVKERESLREAQAKRQKAETLQRQARFRKGLRGFFDRLNGHHRHILERNELETYETLQRDQQERDALIFAQLDQRRDLQARIERLRKFGQVQSRSLSRDMDQYREIGEHKRELTEFNKHLQSRRSHRSPGRER